MLTAKNDTVWVVSEVSITGFCKDEETQSYAERNGGVVFTDREEAENEYYNLRMPENFFWEP